MDNLLFPAFQKFYSAVSSLERFNTENNFFDNISSLDTFFSEYRNITFVIQKSLKNTEYNSIYEKNRDKYLTDHWFVEKRNETIKQQPFQLIKHIEITVFSPGSGVKVLSEDFSIENDTPIKDIIDSMKEFFLKINPIEVFFSAKYSFYEKGNDTNIWNKINSGLTVMYAFMEAMYQDIGAICDICNQLRMKIKEIVQILQVHDIRLVDDYIYYPQKDEFERGDYIAAIIGDGNDKTISRMPLKNFMQTDLFNYDGTPFVKFTLMHAVMISTQRDLMPTFMIIYKDDTFDLISYNSSIKTTVYRKINEIAELIKTDIVKEVFYMTVYCLCEVSADIIYKTSKERQETAKHEFLVCMKADDSLNTMEYAFECDKAKDLRYIAYCLKNGGKDYLEIGKINFMPIVNAFKEKSNDI